MDAHQTSIYTAILLTALIIGGILVFFIFSLVKHQRRNNRLYKAKILAEITTLENERTRVASDLHDELGPLLSAIKFKLSSIETVLPEDEAMIDEINQHCSDIIDRMRDISNDLMPNTLLRKGLTFAVEEFINKTAVKANESIHKLDIRFNYEKLPELSRQITINTYRIILEIIHNTIKHSKAGILNIKLIEKNGNLLFHSEDNGVGFDHERISKEYQGLGLRNLVSRTEILNGSIFIDSRPGKGTIYNIEIPIS